MMLRVSALTLSGLVAGIYAGVAIGDARIRDLTANQYAALHRSRDQTFRKVMPPLGFSTVTILAVCAISLAGSLSAQLFAVAALVEAADIAVAIRWQVPRNRQVQAWASAAPPAAWRDVRDGWDATHKVRTGLGLAIFAMTAAACLI